MHTAGPGLLVPLNMTLTNRPYLPLQKKGRPSMVRPAQVVHMGWFTILAFLLTGAAPTWGATPPPDNRLVVLIVVDQMRADYLARWSGHFNGGFARLLQEGAFFPNAYVSYGASETAPGHASIATGCLPRQHGIVGNKWFLAPGVTRPQQPVDDPNAELVGAETPAGGAPSPSALLAPTLGDQMKLADRRSRVYSVALKDRAAVFLAGRAADGVFWCDKPTGHVVTSTYYAAHLPAYVEECNTAGGAWQYAGRTWEPLLGPEIYSGQTPADAAWSTVLPKIGAAFPHRLPAAPTGRDAGYSELVFGTPFGNELVLGLAQAIIEAEKLGRGPAPDMVCVGLSSNDYVGHYFGPDSAEVLDVTLRTDRQLGAFFDWLDQEVGQDHYIVALTADHGMSSSRYAAQRLRLGGGTLDTAALATALERAWRDVLKGDAPQQPLVLGINVPWVYCAPQFQKLDENLAGKLTQAATKLLRETPGIVDAFTAAELAGPAPDASDHDRWLAWRSYHPRRAGEFYIRLVSGWMEQDAENLAAHAGGSRSDRHVPILLAGAGVRAGWYYDEADLLDIAPTLSALLGIEPPAEAVGHVLGPALRAGACGEWRAQPAATSQPGGR
jgi:arylsulfatase A-like enzyme